MAQLRTKNNIAFDSDNDDDDDDDDEAVFATCPYDDVANALERVDDAQLALRDEQDKITALRNGSVYSDVTNELNAANAFDKHRAEEVMWPYLQVLKQRRIESSSGNTDVFPHGCDTPEMSTILVEHLYAGVRALIDSHELRTIMIHEDSQEDSDATWLYTVLPRAGGDGFSPNQECLVHAAVRPLVVAFFAHIEPTPQHSHNRDYRMYLPIWVALCAIVHSGPRQALIVAATHRICAARDECTNAQRAHTEAEATMRKFRRLMAAKPYRVHAVATKHGNFEPFIVDTDECTALTCAYALFANDTSWSHFDALTSNGCSRDDSDVYTDNEAAVVLLDTLSEYAPTGIAYTMRSLRIMRNIGWHAYIDERLERYRRRSIRSSATTKLVAYANKKCKR